MVNFSTFVSSPKETTVPFTRYPSITSFSRATDNHRSAFCLHRFDCPGRFIKRSHITCSLLCLASFNQRNVSKARSHCSMCQYLVPFHCQMIVHCLDLPHAVNPFVCLRTLGLFPPFGSSAATNASVQGSAGVPPQATFWDRETGWLGCHFSLYSFCFQSRS